MRLQRFAAAAAAAAVGYFDCFHSSIPDNIPFFTLQFFCSDYNSTTLFFVITTFHTRSDTQIYFIAKFIILMIKELFIIFHKVCVFLLNFYDDDDMMKTKVKRK